MSAPDFEIAQSPDRQAVISLLENANLPTTDLTDEHLERFFFVGPRSAPFGLVGLEVRGVEALLRSLVVDPGFRASGAGSALLAHAEHYARLNGVVAVYLLTTTAEPFFALRGYVRIERREAPPSIRLTREFSDLCPASSALMAKRLSAQSG